MNSHARRKARRAGLTPQRRTAERVFFSIVGAVALLFLLSHGLAGIEEILVEGEYCLGRCIGWSNRPLAMFELLLVHVILVVGVLSVPPVWLVSYLKKRKRMQPAIAPESHASRRAARSNRGARSGA